MTPKNEFSLTNQREMRRLRHNLDQFILSHALEDGAIVPNVLQKLWARNRVRGSKPVSPLLMRNRIYQLANPTNNRLYRCGQYAFARVCAPYILRADQVAAAHYPQMMAIFQDNANRRFTTGELLKLAFPLKYGRLMQMLHRLYEFEAIKRISCQQWFLNPSPPAVAKYRPTIKGEKITFQRDAQRLPDPFDDSPTMQLPDPFA